MKWQTLLAALAFGVTTAQADPITYEGTLTTLVPATGEVGGFSYIDSNVPQMDFWRVFARGGNTLVVTARRLVPELDPALSLYRGETSADASLFTPYASFDGLTFLGSADDELTPPAGPYGDPLIRIGIHQTGYYTIAIGGSASDLSGLLPYTITAHVIPAPASFVLMAAGLFALGWSRRRS